MFKKIIWRSYRKEKKRKEKKRVMKNRVLISRKRNKVRSEPLQDVVEVLQKIQWINQQEEL